MAKVALGKGLGALISSKKSAPEPLPGEEVREIELSRIVPSPLQPRKQFNDEQIRELSESIREHGIIQPLILREVDQQFELVAGERRWRAATLLKLDKVPAIIREVSDRDVLELALIENLQREDLNVIEEAEAYRRLATEFGLRQEDIARHVGKSRAAVANAMRLLDLADQVQSWLVQGRLSAGHAKVLLGLKDPAEQAAMAEEVIRSSWTVRETEKRLAQRLQRGPSRTSSPNGTTPRAVDPAVQHLENRLREYLATRVSLNHSDKKGRLEIEYYGLDDLHRVLEVIGFKTE